MPEQISCKHIEWVVISKPFKYKIVPLMVYTKHYTLNAHTIIGEKLVEGHSI